jgi:hypothetical protein
VIFRLSLAWAGDRMVGQVRDGCNEIQHESRVTANPTIVMGKCHCLHQCAALGSESRPFFTTFVGNVDSVEKH